MNRQIISEPMRVELGIWPIFLPFVAAWHVIAPVATVVAQTAVAATPYVAAALTVNSLIQSFNQPKGSEVSIPGLLGAKELSSTVATSLQRQQTELETLQQEGLKKQEELAAIEAQVALKQKTTNFLSKYGPFLVAGGIVLVTVLAVRKKKKK
jgi:hypothetical protein